jgi:hypothetical protein
LLQDHHLQTDDADMLSGYVLPPKTPAITLGQEEAEDDKVKGER